MNVDKYSQHIYTEAEAFDVLMSNPANRTAYGPFLLESTEYNTDTFKQYTDLNLTIADFDANQQKEWFMSPFYKNIDIASHILDLCNNDQAKLQRVGAELLLFQELNLFNLLRYLLYLVDTMTANKIIWGVGRGSSVASYVLYLLKVHKIDSMFYDLDYKEFLRV